MKRERLFRVSMSVQVDTLTIVLDALRGEYRDLEIKEAVDTTNGAAPAQHKRAGRSGAEDRMNAIRAELAKLGVNASITPATWEGIVTRAGYSPTSHSPVATDFVRIGVLGRMGGRGGGYRVIDPAAR